MNVNMNKIQITTKTAVPNITVPIGSTRELAPSEILAADSTDYLLGSALTMRNGRIDKYQFEEGYCQAVKSTFNPSQDGFTFYYYDRDHLGSVRQVIDGRHRPGNHCAEDELLSLRPAVLQQRHGQRRAAAPVQWQGIR